MDLWVRVRAAAEFAQSPEWEFVDHSLVISLPIILKSVIAIIIINVVYILSLVSRGAALTRVVSITY